MMIGFRRFWEFFFFFKKKKVGLMVKGAIWEFPNRRRKKQEALK